MQGELFSEDAERSRSASEIEWKLRQLLRAWRDCIPDGEGGLAAVNDEIRRFTRTLDEHPVWFVLLACECRACRDRSAEIDRDLREEEARKREAVGDE